MSKKDDNVRFVNFKKAPPKQEGPEFEIPTYPMWFVYSFVGASILFCLFMIVAIAELFQ
jgi:hypothetical protein